MNPRLILAAVCLLLAVTGCAHPAPRAIALPTTAAVRAPLVAAQSANARAVQIVAKAQRTGLAAGSADLLNLTADLAETKVQLATATAKVDALTAQLLAKQKDVDTQTTRLAEMTTKLNAAEKTIWWYRLRFWGPLVFTLLAVGVFLVARFTAWGARTIGPYLVDAEHLAVKAAVVA